MVVEVLEECTEDLDPTLVMDQHGGPTRSCRSTLTVSSKTVAMSNLDVVHKAHHKHLWEFHFALVGTNKVQTLCYKLILGSCDLAQWLWRYGHSKSVISLQQFCTFH